MEYEWKQSSSIIFLVTLSQYACALVRSFQEGKPFARHTLGVGGSFTRDDWYRPIAIGSGQLTEATWTSLPGSERAQTWCLLL